jgi:hypothetical protein
MPRVDCLRSVPIERSPRVRQLEGMFDVPPAERSERRWQVSLPIEERDWNVGLIVGPSGCGKSTLARECFGNQPDPMWPTDRAVVDAFPPTMGIKEIVALLSSVGFSSPPERFAARARNSSPSPATTMLPTGSIRDCSSTITI